MPDYRARYNLPYVRRPKSRWGNAGVLAGQLPRALRRFGPWDTFRFGTQAICAEYLARIRASRRIFVVDGQTYRYLPTYGTNERIIEIPYAIDFVGRHAVSGARMLEVGNVLVGHLDYPRDVVDRYEQAPGILNRDIRTFIPSAPYDIVVSISTVEHVGWDEPEVELLGAPSAIENLYCNCLAEGGDMLISVPLGYNPAVDAMFSGGNPLGIGRSVFLRRVSAFNEWEQIQFQPSQRELVFPEYSSRYIAANLLAFWEVSKPRSPADCTVS